MNRGAFLVIGILVIVMALAVSSAAFTVHQTTQAIVMQLGNPKRVVTEAGLHWKLPFIQDVLYYDKRMPDARNPHRAS
ncbi:MAG: SPFH domain-containing protein [Alphaproteobacteria bacterium]|nr:SPFH domain-containing protein [Alphaproteobacteria bacterium]